MGLLRRPGDPLKCPEDPLRVLHCLLCIVLTEFFLGIAHEGGPLPITSRGNLILILPALLHNRVMLLT